MLISQSFDCNIENVTIWNGRIFTLGHENVQLIGGLIGNCIGTCNILNSMVYVNTYIYHNSNYQQIQMPVGGIIGLCNKKCKLVNTFNRLNVHSETIYTPITIGGLIGVSKAEQIIAISCISQQYNDFRYSLKIRNGGVFGDDRSQFVNLTEVQATLHTQVNNSQVIENIGLISGNNICNNSSYINLLLDAYGYVKNIYQNSTTQWKEIKKFGVDTTIEFTYNSTQDGQVKYYPNEIAKQIYTYKSVPGINQCTNRSFEDICGGNSNQTFTNECISKYKIEDDVCERLIMHSINQDYSDISKCDEQKINISCGSNAICQKFEINKLSLYFQYKNVYKCTCLDDYTFYNQTCILTSSIKEEEEAMPKPPDDGKNNTDINNNSSNTNNTSIDNSSLQWIKDLKIDRNLQLTLGIGIPICLLLIIIPIILIYCLRNKPRYIQYLNNNSSSSNQKQQNNKKLSIKKQDQNTNNNQANIKQEEKISQLNNISKSSQSQNKQKHKIVKKHHKKDNQNIINNQNNTQQQQNNSNIQQIKQPLIPITQQTQTQQVFQQQSEQFKQPQIQQLQLITNIPQPDQLKITQPQTSTQNQTNQKFEICDKDYYATNKVNQYLNKQDLGHLPGALPTYITSNSDNQEQKHKKQVKKRKHQKNQHSQL